MLQQLHILICGIRSSLAASLFPLFFFVGEGTEYSRIMLYINSLYNVGRGQGKGGVPSFIELAENDLYI